MNNYFLNLLIKYNKIKELIELVHNGKTLIFSYHNNNNIFRETFSKTIQKLFILINFKNKDKQIHEYNNSDQTNEETIELILSFYQLLFNRYKEYFNFFNFAEIAIKSDNLLILKLIIDKEYINKSMTTNQLINALLPTYIKSKSSLKILKYISTLTTNENNIINNNNNNNNNNQFEKYTITEILNFIEQYPQKINLKFKILNYLLENDQIKKERIRNKYMFIIPKKLFDDDPFYNNFTIQNTIDACSFFYNIKYRPYTLNKQLEKINENLKLIETNNPFNKLKLKTRLKKVIHNSSNTIIENKYLELILSTYQLVIQKPMLIHYLKYQISNENNDNQQQKDEEEEEEKEEEEKNEKYKRILKNGLPSKLNSAPIHQNKYIKQSIKFGNLDYCLFKNQKIEVDDIFNLYVEKENMNLLFKYCKDNKEHQFSFIDQVLKPDGQYNQIMDHFLLICLLIHFNDISLLEYVFNNKLYNNVSASIENQIKLVYSIKSIEMLNYCWSNPILNIFFNKTSIATCFQFGRIDMIKRYQQLVPKEQNIWKSLTNGEFKGFNRYCLNGKILKTLCYMISNPEIFDLSNVDIVGCINKSFDKHLYIDEIKFIIKNSPLSLEFPPSIFYEPFRSRLLKTDDEFSIKVFTNPFKNNEGLLAYKICKWLYEIRLNVDILESKKHGLVYLETLQCIGKFGEYFSTITTIPSNGIINKITNEIARLNNFNGLLKIIELYFKFEKINPIKYLDLLKFIMVGCAEYGNLYLIKYMVLYQNNLFQKIFDPNLISSIISTSFLYGNFNILDYFLNSLNLNYYDTIIDFSMHVPTGLNFGDLIKKINIAQNNNF
ncbi:hypothetical protein ACTFIW_001105 [Dictyostelium discoideum]